MNINPRFLAQKITEQHVSIFTKCPPRAIFYSKRMRAVGMKAADLKKKVDILAYLVTQSIYESSGNKALNGEFHEFFLETIYQLCYKHNLLACFGFAIGFTSFRVNRFEKPQLRDDILKIKAWLDELTDPKDGSYPKLIEVMKEIGSPCVPYFGSFQNIFEKVFSADIKDVGLLYLSIGKATEETRRNRSKWNDFVYEDSQCIDNAYEMNFNEWCENPWSDAKLFDSMVKSNKFRLIHKNEDIPRRKKSVSHLRKSKNGFKIVQSSICRYTKYLPLK